MKKLNRRNFIKLGGGSIVVGTAGVSIPTIAIGATKKVVVIGGGAGGTITPAVTMNVTDSTLTVGSSAFFGFDFGGGGGRADVTVLNSTATFGTQGVSSGFVRFGGRPGSFGSGVFTNSLVTTQGIDNGMHAGLGFTDGTIGDGTLLINGGSIIRATITTQ